MMRQSSSRNQRSKGLKTKSFLQIFILAAVCFWLLYQLKHSLDKKRALEGRSSRMLEDVDDSQLGLIKLGRKDIPQTEVKSSHNDINNEGESEEAEEEDEDQEVRRAMEDLEGRGNGDDEIDEQDHEEEDEQEDQERGDEETESVEDDTNEEEKDEKVEEAELREDQERDDGSHEAREDSYKKDDASSVVHRENQESGSEQQKHGQHEDGEENFGKKVVETYEAANAKDDGSLKGNGNSSTFGSLVANETNSGNNLTTSETAIERTYTKVESNDPMASVGETHLELQSNSSTSNASETGEKLQINSAPVTSNETEIAYTKFVDTSNTTLPLNETLGNSSAVEQMGTAESGNEEDDKVHLKGVIEQPRGTSTRTTGHDNLHEHSSISLASDRNEKTTQSEVNSSSNRVVIEEEEARIDLSTLPDIQTDIKKFEESTLNEI